MADQNEIDKTSEQIVKLVDKARADVLKQLYDIRRAYTLGAFTDLMLTIDLEGTLKNKLKNALSVYANAHRGVLETTIGFSEIDPKALTSLAKLNEQLFDNSIIRTISGNMRNKLVSGVQAGLTLTEITESVISSSISNAQMETLINTTLNTYSRQVTNQMMKNAPNNTKYVYVGPVDSVTRDECLDMAGAGELTLDQIISQFGEAPLVDGGGFNCRHKWEIASTEGKGFSEQSKVEGQRKANA